MAAAARRQLVNSSICTVVAVLTLTPLQIAVGAGHAAATGAAATDIYVAGSGGVAEQPVSGGAATTLGWALNQPSATAVDSAGNLFIADTGNERILEVPAGSGEAQPVSTGSITLKATSGVAVDSAGDLFITDYDPDGGNGRVIEVPAGGATPHLVDLGSYALDTPEGIAVDTAGDIFVSGADDDSEEGEVIEVPSGGGTPHTVNVGSLAHLSPGGVAVDVAGDVFVVDTGNDRVVEGPAGGGTPHAVNTGSLTLDNPTGVAVDSSGDVFVSDLYNSRVVEVPAGGGTPHAVATGSVSVVRPAGVTVDSTGNLFVADSDANRIAEVPLGGGTSKVVELGSPTLDSPTAVASDAAGDLYVADTGIVSGVGEVVEEPFGDAPHVVNTGSLTLTDPTGLAVDSDGDLFIADGSAVDEVPAGGATPHAVNTGTVTLTDARQIAFDAAGDLFIADLDDNSGKSRIVKVPVGGASPSVVSFGTVTTYYPQGLAIDAEGDLFLSDYCPNCSNLGVYRVLEAPAGGGTPQPIDTGSLTLQGPAGLAVDADDDLFVTDAIFGNDRVVEVPPGGGSASTVASGTATPWAFASSLAIAPAAAAPGVPTGVSASPDETSAHVYWAAPSSNGGSAITGYDLQYSSNSGSSWTSASSSFNTSTATSQTVTGLTDGVPYEFRVAAINSVGTGDYSSAVGPITPNPETVPGAPTGVGVTAGNAQASVSWTAPTNDGESAITGYDVQYSSNSGSSWTSASSTFHTSTATTQTVTGLVNGTSYEFRVAAINSVGTGDYSSPSSSVIPTAPTAPAAPTGVSASAENAQASVSWTAPTDNGDAAITGYDVQYSSNSGSSWTSASSSFHTMATSQTVTGLTNGTSYVFRVAAINSVNTGAYSAPSAAVTPTAPAPSVDATALTDSINHASITDAASATISGVLTDTRTNAGVSGATVALLTRASASKPWTTLLSNTSSASGAVSASVKPTANTQYAWYFAGDSTHTASVGPVLSVHVDRKVTATASKHSVKKNKSVSIYGTVAPGAKGVKVVLQQKIHGKWVATSHTAKLKTQDLPNGKHTLGYVIKITEKHKGTLSYRIATAATSSNGAGDSRAITVKVTS